IPSLVVSARCMPGSSPGPKARVEARKAAILYQRVPAMVNLKASENAAERSLKALGRAEFTVAAHALKQLPPDLGVEVACAGRSNAGKSSALNAISGRRDLARVSKTPG